MLVLSRKSTESIVVDGRIVITILNVRGNTVRVGVSAPDDVHILRAELQTDHFHMEPVIARQASR